VIFLRNQAMVWREETTRELLKWFGETGGGKEPPAYERGKPTPFLEKGRSESLKKRRRPKKGALIGGDAPCTPVQLQKRYEDRFREGE